jgi:hypothetical protein
MHCASAATCGTHGHPNRMFHCKACLLYSWQWFRHSTYHLQSTYADTQHITYTQCIQTLNIFRHSTYSDTQRIQTLNIFRHSTYSDTQRIQTLNIFRHSTYSDTQRIQALNILLTLAEPKFLSPSALKQEIKRQQNSFWFQSTQQHIILFNLDDMFQPLDCHQFIFTNLTVRPQAVQITFM